MQEDTYAKFKYDKTAEQDSHIISRVEELAGRYGVSMTQISLAWLLTKVTAPVVGATKIAQIDDIAASVNIHLTSEDIAYLEEPYIPHALAGVMAQNRPAMTEKPVWIK